jgi:hypothetical protein
MSSNDPMANKIWPSQHLNMNISHSIYDEETEYLKAFSHSYNIIYNNKEFMPLKDLNILLNRDTDEKIVNVIHSCLLSDYPKRYSNVDYTPRSLLLNHFKGVYQKNDKNNIQRAFEIYWAHLDGRIINNQNIDLKKEIYDEDINSVKFRNETDDDYFQRTKGFPKYPNKRFLSYYDAVSLNFEKLIENLFKPFKDTMEYILECSKSKKKWKEMLIEANYYSYYNPLHDENINHIINLNSFSSPKDSIIFHTLLYRINASYFILAVFERIQKRREKIRENMINFSKFNDDSNADNNCLDPSSTIYEDICNQDIVFKLQEFIDTHLFLIVAIIDKGIFLDREILRNKNFQPNIPESEKTFLSIFDLFYPNDHSELTWKSLPDITNYNVRTPFWSSKTNNNNNSSNNNNGDGTNGTKNNDMNFNVHKLIFGNKNLNENSYELFYSKVFTHTTTVSHKLLKIIEKIVGTCCGSRSFDKILFQDEKMNKIYNKYAPKLEELKQKKENISLIQAQVENIMEDLNKTMDLDDEDNNTHNNNNNNNNDDDQNEEKEDITDESTLDKNNKAIYDLISSLPTKIEISKKTQSERLELLKLLETSREKLNAQMIYLYKLANNTGPELEVLSHILVVTMLGNYEESGYRIRFNKRMQIVKEFLFNHPDSSKMEVLLKNYHNIMFVAIREYLAKTIKLNSPLKYVLTETHYWKEMEEFFFRCGNWIRRKFDISDIKNNENPFYTNKEIKTFIDSNKPEVYRTKKDTFIVLMCMKLKEMYTNLLASIVVESAGIKGKYITFLSKQKINGSKPKKVLDKMFIELIEREDGIKITNLNQILGLSNNTNEEDDGLEYLYSKDVKDFEQKLCNEIFQKYDNIISDKTKNSLIRLAQITNPKKFNIPEDFWFLYSDYELSQTSAYLLEDIHEKYQAGASKDVIGSLLDQLLDRSSQHLNNIYDFLLIYHYFMIMQKYCLSIYVFDLSSTYSLYQIAALRRRYNVPLNKNLDSNHGTIGICESCLSLKNTIVTSRTLDNPNYFGFNDIKYDFFTKKYLCIMKKDNNEEYKRNNQIEKTRKKLKRIWFDVIRKRTSILIKQSIFKSHQEDQLRFINLVGKVLHKKKKNYIICPGCARFTYYNMDNIGPMGLVTCTHCDIENRRKAMGQYCLFSGEDNPKFLNKIKIFNDKVEPFGLQEIYISDAYLKRLQQFLSQSSIDRNLKKRKSYNSKMDYDDIDIDEEELFSGSKGKEIKTAIINPSTNNKTQQILSLSTLIEFIGKTIYSDANQIKSEIN